MKATAARGLVNVILTGAVAIGCAHERGDDGSSGGGPTHAGGTNTGGADSGGTNPGGTNPGGTNPGGTNSGGASDGGSALGGSSAGAVTGGTETGSGAGGAATGGANAGGTTTGGSDGGGGSATGGEAAAGAGGGGASTGGNAAGGSEGGASTGGASTGGAGGSIDPGDGPAAGNPDGNCAVPDDAGPEDTSTPDQVVGDGTPGSCTSDRVVAAVAAGGVITFDCGPAPVTIVMTETAIVDNASERVVIDGGGLITLSGDGTHRILYQNTCDRVVGWTSPTCDNQPNPELAVQNITFIDGNARWSPDPSPDGTPAGNQVYAEYVGDEDVYTEEGGGAIYAQGGRLKIVNSRFFGNVCAEYGPDIGGGAVRAFQQYQGQPVYVVNSTFGGADGFGNSGSNGGALSSIGVSWTIINSVLSYNSAVGYRGNPAEDGTEGGGSGGAIYNDGNTMTLTICGSLIQYNTARAYGSAIFFVSNDLSGDIRIDQSIITYNTGGGWEPTYEQISNHDDTPIVVTDSVIAESP